MNTLKRISAIVLALVMVLSLGVTVFAVEDHGPEFVDKTEFDITIIPTDDESHTYAAYQIFAGKVAEEVKDGKTIPQLSQITWGASVVLDTETDDAQKGSAFLTALKEDEKIGTFFAKCKDAEDVAEVLAGANFASNSDNAYAFADVVADFVEEHQIQPVKTASGTRTAKPETEPVEYTGVTIENVPAGYYVVMDNANVPGEGAKTRYILRLVEDVEVKSKSDAPSVDKKIVEGDKKVDANEAGVNEKVNYEITTAVPNMDGYEKYFFVVNDTMSEGLTFNDDITIMIGDTEIKPCTCGAEGKMNTADHVCTTNDGKSYYYTVTTNDKNETVIKIVFNNFIQYKDVEDKNIVITYSATLNEKAVVGDPGNPNDVDLVFSNDPNWDYEGKNEPGPDEPKGETPKERVWTFTAGVEIEKVDKDGELAGAEFKIVGKTQKAVTVTGTHYVPWVGEGEEPTKYYLLEGGAYTTTAPTETTAKLYPEYKADGQTPAYMKETYTSTKIVETEDVEMRAFVDEHGKLSFVGLAEGYYFISEVAAPEGYNILKEGFLLQLRATPADPIDESNPSCKWEYRYCKQPADFTFEGKDEAALNKLLDDALSAGETTAEWTRCMTEQVAGDDTDETEDDVYKDLGKLRLVIENKKGLELPGTGGMGTTIFYIVGGLMLVVALAVCVAKVMAPKAVSTKIESI